MLLSLDLYNNMKDNPNAVLCCIPSCYTNYTGIATFVEADGGRFPDTPEVRQALTNACLFPSAMVKQAVESGSMRLQGGDWGVFVIPDGVETCSDYFDFTLDIYGEHPVLPG